MVILARPPTTWHSEWSCPKPLASRILVTWVQSRMRTSFVNENGRTFKFKTVQSILTLFRHRIYGPLCYTCVRFPFWWLGFSVVLSWFWRLLWRGLNVDRLWARQDFIERQCRSRSNSWFDSAANILLTDYFCHKYFSAVSLELLSFMQNHFKTTFPLHVNVRRKKMLFKESLKIAISCIGVLSWCSVYLGWMFT